MASCGSVTRVSSRNITPLGRTSVHTLRTKASVSVISYKFLGALRRSLGRTGMARRRVGVTYHHMLRTGCGLKLFSGPCGCYSTLHTGRGLCAPRRHSTTHTVTTRAFILLGGSGGLLPLRRGNEVTLVNPVTSTHGGVYNV